MATKKHIRISHAPTGTLLAEGPLGWGITPFEGNYYVAGKYLRTNGFRINFFPGVCIYKFIYMWMDFTAPDGSKTRGLAWKYIVPNPLFPFIWFRVGIPGYHPEIDVAVREV